MHGKRAALAGFISLLALAALASTGPAALANSSCGKADTISTACSLKSGKTYAGTIAGEDEFDTYKVELAKGQKVEVSLSNTTDPASECREDLAFLTKSAHELGGGKAAGGQTFKKTFSAPFKGSFYIQVSACGLQAEGTYKLVGHVRRKPRK